MLMEHSHATQGTGGVSYFEHSATTFNFYDYMHKYLKLHTSVTYE